MGTDLPAKWPGWTRGDASTGRGTGGVRAKGGEGEPGVTQEAGRQVLPPVSPLTP